MQIVRDLGGYSYGRSDLVRRAMSKKKMDVMLEEKEYFIHGKTDDDDGNVEIAGCVRNGVPEDAAEEIFNQMGQASRNTHSTSPMQRHMRCWLMRPAI